MAFAAEAAQLFSASLFRCYVSGRLGLNLLPRRFKLCSFLNEKGPRKGALYSFWWRGRDLLCSDSKDSLSPQVTYPATKQLIRFGQMQCRGGYSDTTAAVAGLRELKNRQTYNQGINTLRFRQC